MTDAASPLEPGTVTRLAALSRIAIPEDRTAILEKEFGSIITYIGQLEDLQNVKTTTPRVPVVRNQFRMDEHPTVPGTWTERVVAAFPARIGNALSVKKIISHD